MTNQEKNKPERPLVVVIAGPNGSGKTSFTSEFLNHEWSRDCAYINPDEIAQNQFGDWNSVEAVLKAVKQAQQMREDYLANLKNFIFETVLSSNEKVEFLRSCRDSGYFIRLYFIATKSPAINAYRVARRVMQGGHDVPISKIISRYTKSISNCAACLSLADRAYIYDNSESHKLQERLFRVREGQIVKIDSENLPDWAAKIKSKIETLNIEVAPVRQSGLSR